MNKRQTKEIGLVLLNQFNSSWKMLRQAIEIIGDENWSKTANNWSFVWTVYHIIETADYYRRNTPKGMEWGKRAGINWETDSEEIIEQKKIAITKAQVLAYLEDVKTQIIHFLENATDPDLLTTNDFDEGKLLILEKMLYLLRHNMHHIGELNKALRDWKSQRIQWR
ncbi:MAG: DinB family protein [Candidatus Heimdallarchaeota archaeon]